MWYPTHEMIGYKGEDLGQNYGYRKRNTKVPHHEHKSKRGEKEAQHEKHIDGENIFMRRKREEFDHPQKQIFRHGVIIHGEPERRSQSIAVDTEKRIPFPCHQALQCKTHLRVTIIGDWH